LLILVTVSVPDLTPPLGRGVASDPHGNDLGGLATLEQKTFFSKKEEITK